MVETLLDDGGVGDLVLTSKCRMTRQIAEGGMAEVYLGRRVGLGGLEKPVVIKRLLPSYASDLAWRQMLLNEARAAARLNHPNIVELLDIGERDGEIFLVMELLLGETLAMILNRARKADGMPAGVACRIVADMLAALEYAHGRGLIHRDVAPDNLITTYAGVSKLIDFGIAKAAQSAGTHQTLGGRFKGKVGYMSPEQMRGEPIDARTDIFSAGVVLWEALCCRRLFKRKTINETAQSVLSGPIPAARSIVTGLAPAIDEVLSRALARSVEDRFSTAAEFRSALEGVIRDQGWAADPLTMQRFMGTLCADKLRVQEERLHESGLRSLEELIASNGAARGMAPTPELQILTSDGAAPLPIILDVISLDAILGESPYDGTHSESWFESEQPHNGSPTPIEFDLSRPTSMAAAAARTITSPAPPPPPTARLPVSRSRAQARVTTMLCSALCTILVVLLALFVRARLAAAGSAYLRVGIPAATTLAMQPLSSRETGVKKDGNER